jgi:hypothetical protein
MMRPMQKNHHAQQSARTVAAGLRISRDDFMLTQLDLLED